MGGLPRAAWRAAPNGNGSERKGAPGGHRASWKRLGRPPIPDDKQDAIREALKERTEGVRKIAARFGVDPSTVQPISVAMRPFGENAVSAG